MKKEIILSLCAAFSICCTTVTAQRQKFNFNGNWQIHYPAEALQNAGKTRTVTLPRAWNEDWAYRVNIAQLPDDTCRYTKVFNAPTEWEGKHVFIEFEGARQSAEVWLNGHRLGIHQNGVMAFGFDLTPYIIIGKENLLEVLTDNDWAYKEKNPTASTFQWNNKNFNINMGGLPKNVNLHVTDAVYQTLPLYSNLGTIGTYIYGSNYDIKGKKVTANAEAQVINSTKSPQRVSLEVEVIDREGKKIAQFSGKSKLIAAGDTTTL